jgi:predicted HTH domain antitoxin
MQVTVDIPDAIAKKIGQQGGDAAREVLVAFAVEEYRAEKLSRGQVSELLGLDFWETEELLKRRGAYLHYDSKDFECDRESLRKLLAR